MQRRESTLTVNGLALHCTEWGPADGRPIVMLHGIRGYGETFAGVAAALQPGWRVIALDQRGRGASAWDPAWQYHTAAYVADLAGVVDRLGLDRFMLLGHSMGGINAIVYASQNPARVDRLIIEDAGPGAFEASPGATRIRQELASTPARFDSWDAAATYMRALRPTVSEAARQQRLRSMLKPDPQGPAVGTAQNADPGWTWRYDHAGIAATRLNPAPDSVVDLRPHVARLACPTLVLRGGRSDYLQADMAQAMADANPRLRWQTIADAGHYIHDDQPAAFHAAVLAFLAED